MFKPSDMPQKRPQPEPPAPKIVSAKPKAFYLRPHLTERVLEQHVELGDLLSRLRNTNK